jgi:hypothetical protein
VPWREDISKAFDQQRVVQAGSAFPFAQQALEALSVA